MARLLVVDDDPAIGKFVRRGLEADGHMVTVTANAPTAVRLAQDTRAEVAIVDIVMPEIDGRSLLPLLLAVRPGLRVIMLSVDADVSTRVDCFDGGAADFVPKPFSIRELAARVQVQLRGQRQPAEPGALRVGDVALDRIRRTVHVRGTAIHLSNREFSVLQQLMSRAGTVCTASGCCPRSGATPSIRARTSSTCASDASGAAWIATATSTARSSGPSAAPVTPWTPTDRCALAISRIAPRARALLRTAPAR